jgi:hypothetical protein
MEFVDGTVVSYSAYVFNLCDRGLINKYSCLIIILSHVRIVHLFGTPSSSCSNTGSIRGDPYWTSREIGLELIELSNINKVSLV